MDEYEDRDDGYDNLFARRNHRQHQPHNMHHRPHPRQPQQQVDPLRSLGLRTEIPEFEGRLQPDEFLDWIQTVERIFDLRDIPDNLKVKLVAIKLKKNMLRYGGTMCRLSVIGRANTKWIHGTR